MNISNVEAIQISNYMEKGDVDAQLAIIDYFNCLLISSLIPTVLFSLLMVYV